MSDLVTRAHLVRTALALHAAGLCPGTSGNASVRLDTGFVITPSGVPYPALSPDQMVTMNLDGTPKDGPKPSSEWRLHQAIYRARPDIEAIVHTHSPHATALACLRRGIPAFHYHVAFAGGPDIRCAAYATYGSDELAANAVAALDERRACLLANHGVVALGATLDAAFGLALEVENLARLYLLAEQAGEPVILDEAEIRRVLEGFETYGQKPSPA